MEYPMNMLALAFGRATGSSWKGEKKMSGKASDFRKKIARTFLAPGAWLLVLPVLGSALLAAQTPPSSDPAPLAIVLTRLDRGDTEGAARLLKENLPVTKSRLEAVLQEIDRKFDEAGRFGATSGHEGHENVLQRLLDENDRYEKVFDLYSTLSEDETLYKRFKARKLRIEGAFYTHAGEHACGETLDWTEAQRQYQTALERLEAGFALAKEVNDLRIMASAKINMGSTLVRLVEPEKAIAAYNEGMQYADQVPGEMYRGMVRMNLGNAYVWTQQPDQSLTYLQPALESFKKMGRGTWQANVLLTIGNAQMLQKKFSSAWETFRLVLDLAIQSGEDRVRGQVLLNLGTTAWQLKKPEAASYIQDALEWFKGPQGEVYTALQREVVAQDGLRLLSWMAKENGDDATAATYNKQYYESLGSDPDRYNKLRSSPCYAIYQARSPAQPMAQK